MPVGISPLSNNPSRPSCTHPMGTGCPAGERRVATITSSPSRRSTVFGTPVTVLICRPTSDSRRALASICTCMEAIMDYEPNETLALADAALDFALAAEDSSGGGIS